MSDNARNDNMSKAFRVGARLAISQAVYTSTPGVVSSYNSETKRAVIQPAIMRAFTDGRSSIPMAPMVNVPIVQPATGGYLIHQQINQGDVVLIHFTKEGLDAFKEKWSDESEPTPGKLFTDAFATLVGAYNTNPVSNEGIVLQSADGNAFIHLKRDEIRLRVGNKGVRIDGQHVDLGVV